jgi:hypothetical protein
MQFCGIIFVGAEIFAFTQKTLLTVTLCLCGENFVKGVSMGWFKELLMKLYLIDRPVADRKKKNDRRKGDRRWKGPQYDFPTPRHEPRRKKERRKSERRG